MTVCVPSQQVDEVITNLTGDDMWDEDNDNPSAPSEEDNDNTPSAPSDEELQRIYGVTGECSVMLEDTELDYPMPCCQTFQDSSMIISMMISGAPNRCPNPYCQQPLSIADIPGWCDDFDDDRQQALRNAEICESDDLLMTAIRQIGDEEDDPQQQESDEYEMVQQQWREDEAVHDAQMHLEAEEQEQLQQQLAIEEHGQWLLQQQQQRHHQQALEKEVEEQQQQRYRQQALEREVEEQQQAHAQAQPQAPQDQGRQDSELLQDHIRCHP